MQITLGFLVFLLSFQAWGFRGLEVREIRSTHKPYESFCNQHPSECDLENSKQEVRFSKKVLSKIREANFMVNDELAFSLDSENYDQEEKWMLPVNGSGDCEDNALLKRKVLVEKFNLPRAALRMVTAFHREKFYAHALLAVMTDRGAFILDQDTDEVLLWNEANYIYEALELPGKKWKRFYQEW